jgi:hypothetical protein
MSMARKQAKAKGTTGNVKVPGARAQVLKTLGHKANQVRAIMNRGSKAHAIARGSGGDSTAQGQMGTGGGMAGPNIIGG